MKTDDQIAVIRSSLDKPIVIIGMMGAGKTTLGRRIGEILEWPFFDSDQEIEKDLNISVAEIFEKQGEAYFRQKEKVKIAELLSGRKILSVGGGAITNPETAEAIFASSLCLWVKAPIDVLAKRTAHQENRPLLKGTNIEEALAERMRQREHLYRRAHLEIEGSKAIDIVANNAVGQIYHYLLQN